MNCWREQAALWGIEEMYFDVQGGRHEAGPDVIGRVVQELSRAGASPQRFPDSPPPQFACQGDGRRVWVLAVQLYAVRSRRNWGYGDFTDLGALLETVADAGGAGIGLNPLHAFFHDRPGTGSPYSPSSRLFLNPLYIDVEAIAEFQPGHVAALTPEIERLRASDLADHLAVARLKLAALRAVYRAFLIGGDRKRRDDFDAFRTERGQELAVFAAFETLRSRYRGAWREWPECWRKPDEEALGRLAADAAEEIGFHAFLQWTADRQLAHCRTIALRCGLSIGLYLDTAVGVDPRGADAWAEQGAVLSGLSVGAPPDQYNPAGQDWGLTTYNPHGLIASDFRPLRRMVRAAMRHAGAIRIDHVLGLMRLFVIPYGLGPDRGVYLRYPFETMLAVVAEESRRWNCIAIGEDLGTVPEGFRERLRAWGVWSYLVMLFERNDDGTFRHASDYPEQAIATLNTHDLPTFHGWIGGHDLRIKRGIGIDPGETDDERQAALRALRNAVGPAARLEDVVAFLGRTETRLVSVAMEDVLEMLDQVNVPGTVDEYPNWRRRSPLAIEELGEDVRFRRIADILARAGRASLGASRPEPPRDTGAES